MQVCNGAEAAGSDREFISWIDKLPYGLELIDDVEIPPYISQLQTIMALIKSIYPPVTLWSAVTDYTIFAAYVILSPLNVTVTDLNGTILGQLLG